MNDTILLDFEDPDLFGNDAAEEEDPEILASYFVEKPHFNKFYDPRRRIAIVRARKGMGKSALLAKLNHTLSQDEDGQMVLALKGQDLVGFADFSSRDPLALINSWRLAICRRIALELGRSIRFAATDAEIALVEGAELAGMKSRNLLGSLLDRLKPRIGPIQFDRLPPSDARNVLLAYSRGRSDLAIWVSVDDIDATFDFAPDTCLRTSTFFTALRGMSTDFRGTRFRASVRTDVWTKLARTDEAMDKAVQYLHDLTWSRSETRRILAKRIAAHMTRRGTAPAPGVEWDPDAHSQRLLELAFVPKMEWAGETLTPDKVIHILSAGRPRWAAQLCRLAGRDALVRRQKRISPSNLENVLEAFGRERLDDLHKEHSHQFAGLQALTESFARNKSIYYTPDLLKGLWDRYVESIGGLKYVPTLDGLPVSSPLELAHFLYRIGFINGRVRGEDDSIEFVRYEERPDLLSTTVNPDDGMRWDVHPCYRRALSISRGSVG